MRHRAHYIAILVLCAISCTAQPDPDPTSWFRDITVPPGQTLNGATCFFCSIHVDGELKQDATTQWGDIDIHGVVGGDAVAVAGSIHLYRQRASKVTPSRSSATTDSMTVRKLPGMSWPHGAPSNDSPQLLQHALNPPTGQRSSRRFLLVGGRPSSFG
jgi:hypothetical protein